jgi:hypothetical protein
VLYGIVTVAAAALLWWTPAVSQELPVAGAAFGVRVLAAWFLLAGVLALAAAASNVPVRVAMWLFPLAWAIGPLRAGPGRTPDGGTAASRCCWALCLAQELLRRRAAQVAG